MKNFNLLKMLCLVCLLAFTNLSCEKQEDPKNDNVIESAKDWYLQLTENSTTAFRASNHTTASVATEFLWSKSQTYNFSDGKKVIGTPINLIMNNKKYIIGSCMLLIYKINDIYFSQIIYNENKDFFIDEPTNAEIEKAFTNTQKTNEKKTLAKSQESNSLKISNGKVMVREINPVCIDWYWTTYAYDEYGDIIEIISEVYLYTTCSGDDSGSGGTPPPDEMEFNPDFGHSTSIDEISGAE